MGKYINTTATRCFVSMRFVSFLCGTESVLRITITAALSTKISIRERL